jgi:putative phosphoribosyl transferase
MIVPIPFADRREAGRQLAGSLRNESFEDPIVLALPRGGVPVGFEVAKALRAPLEVFVARKIGAPGRPEFGIGAIAEGGFQVFDGRAIGRLGISPAQLHSLAMEEQAELERRVARYRGTRLLPELAGLDVILVDDGLATGVTAEAALRSLRNRSPKTLVLAVPACAPETRARLSEIADLIHCLRAPRNFLAVGSFYENFEQITDAEVRALLDEASL